jgi:hypothetical protein
LKIKRYSKANLLTLFLIVAFPIHGWSIYLILQDVGWIAERTNAWDSVGYAGYSLGFALIESALIFLIVLLLGYLLPTRWKQKTQVALLSVLFFVVAFWAIAGQVYFILDKEPPGLLFRILYNTNRFGAITFPIFLLIILASVALPIIYLPRSEKFEKIVYEVVDRLMVLSALYIVFDVFGVLVVIYRNWLLPLFS